jgi:hypothetical protein
MAKIEGIFLYSDHPSKSLSIPDIVDYMKSRGVPVQYRGNLFEFLALPTNEAYALATRIAGATVLDITSPLDEIREPINGEIDLELKSIKGEENYVKTGIIRENAGSSQEFRHSQLSLYDGLWLQRVFYNIMASKTPFEFNGSFIHVIFTSRLFVTFETKRYHARVVLTGLPSLISTSGIVEAPARPKEYYWLKAGFTQAGRDVDELEQIYKGKFIEYDDPRLTSVLAPYVLQEVFYEMTGNPFCDNPSCCLYNSHWQEEVLKAQIEQKLCDKHINIIRALNQL